MINAKTSETIFDISLASNFIGILVGLTFLAFGLYTTLFIGSDSDMYAKLLFSTQPHVTMPAQISTVTERLDRSEAVANVMVFSVWAVIGMLLYIIVSVVYHGFQAGRGIISSVALSTSEGRPFVVESIFVRSLLKIVGTLGLYGIMYGCLKGAPYVIVWLSHANQSHNTLMSVALSVGLFVLGYALVYVTMLAIRLLLLRVRIFRWFR